jgi:hypothetical protein
VKQDTGLAIAKANGVPVLRFTRNISFRAVRSSGEAEGAFHLFDSAPTKAASKSGQLVAEKFVMAGTKPGHDQSELCSGGHEELMNGRRFRLGDSLRPGYFWVTF